MMNVVLASVPFVMKIVVGIWVLAAVILILLVLIQKGRGGGLSAAFGGAGNSLLGTKTGDFLTWVTICVVSVWLLLSIAAAKWFRPQSGGIFKSSPAPASAPIQTPQQEQPAPQEANQPTQQ